MGSIEDQLRRELAARGAEAEASAIGKFSSLPNPAHLHSKIRKARRLRRFSGSVVGVAAISLMVMMINQNSDRSREVKVATANGLPSAEQSELTRAPAADSAGEASAAEDAAPTPERSSTPTSSSSDDVGRSKPARSVNQVVAQHPDVFIGVYIDNEVIVAVVENGVDPKHWEPRIDDAAQPSRSRVEACSATIEELENVRQEVAFWVESRASRSPHGGLGFGVDPASCSIRIHGQLAPEERSELQSRFGQRVSFQEANPGLGSRS